MKETWEKIKKPLCCVVMVICMFLFLGCTGTADCGGDLTAYAIQETVLLTVIIIFGIIGKFFG